MDPFLVALMVGCLMFYAFIAYHTAVEVTMDGVFELALLAMCTTIFLLTLKRLRWVYVHGKPQEKLPRWLFSRRCVRLSLRVQDTLESAQRRFYRKGTYTHEAIRTATEFSETHERRWYIMSTPNHRRWLR